LGTPPGHPWTEGALWVFRGILLLLLAVLGEYIGWLLLLARKAPQYVIKKTAAARPRCAEPSKPSEFLRHETL
jgi:hypothetical protein